MISRAYLDITVRMVKLNKESLQHATGMDQAALVPYAPYIYTQPFRLKELGLPCWPRILAVRCCEQVRALRRAADEVTRWMHMLSI